MGIRVVILIFFVLISCKKDNPTIDEPKDVIVDPFNAVPPVEDIVMYEVNLRAFSERGDLIGVKGRLDYLEGLGVNVIWLMPIYPIGIERSVNSPYAVRDYEAVNTEFGTMNDLRNLVNEAHNRNMAVILDWVANHTAWDHPWITDHPGWYVQDMDGNIIIPPNTGWEDVAELNYSNSGMRNEMINSMKFWLDEAGIDGFRCDAVEFVPNDFWQMALAELQSSSDKDLILLAEGGKPENFQGGFEINYAFDFNATLRSVFSEEASAELIFDTNAAEYNAIGNGLKLRYITNHDVYAHDGTLNEFYENKEGSLAAFALTLFLKGIPLIYTGQEIDYPSLISFFQYNYLGWNDNEELISRYKDLIAIRKSSDVFIEGSLKAYPDEDIVMFERETEEDRVLIIINVRNTSVNLTMPDNLQGTSWIDLKSNDTNNLKDNVTLAPYTIKVFKAG